MNSWKTLKRLTLTVLAAESTEKKYDHDKDGISEKEEKSKNKNKIKENIILSGLCSSLPKWEVTFQLS